MSNTKTVSVKALKKAIKSCRDTADRTQEDSGLRPKESRERAFLDGVAQGFRLAAQNVEIEVLLGGWDEFLEPK